MNLHDFLVDENVYSTWPVTVGVIYHDRPEQVQLPGGRWMSKTEFKRRYPKSPICRMTSGKVDINRDLR